MKKYIPYVVIALLLIFHLDQCSKYSELKSNQKNTSEFLNDTISYYKNKLGQEVAEKATLKGDKKQLQILLSNQIDSTGQLRELIKEFKKTSVAGNIITITKIDTIAIPYDSIIDFEFTRKWSKNNKFYTLAGVSNQFGILIDSIVIPNTLSFAIGEKKTGFLKTETKVNVINSNPYVKTKGIDTYTYTYSEQKKRLGLGVSAGYGIGGVYIGIGLNYNLIEF